MNPKQKDFFQRIRLDSEISRSLGVVLDLDNVFQRNLYYLFLIHRFRGCSILVFTKKNPTTPKHDSSQNNNYHKQETTWKPCSVLCRLMGSAEAIRYFQNSSQFHLSLWLLAVCLSDVLLYPLGMIRCWHINHLLHEMIGNPPFPQFIFQNFDWIGMQLKSVLRQPSRSTPKPAKTSNPFLM